MENTEHPSMRPVDIDDLSYDYIANLHQRFQNKLFHPEGDRRLEQLVALRNEWRDEGTVTVFTSGVYDMLHANHAAFLLHAKTAGAQLHYDRNRSDGEKPWIGLSAEEKHDYASLALSKQLLRLIVSVDGSMSVAARKGFKPEKGNVPRPVFGWNTRAMAVASQAFMNPFGKTNEMLPIADAVTVHGPDDFPATSLHSSHMKLVEELQPDVWTIFGESKDILDEAPTRSRLGAVALKCIMDGEESRYYKDVLSTTGIVKKIMGK